MATMPPVALVASPAATDPQPLQPLRQDSKPPPRRRESQPPKDADIISGLDPIAESTAKDGNRLRRRLIKLMEEFNKMVQAAEILDPSHDQAIHQAVFELLGGAKSVELRRFQETLVIVNQVITVSGAVTECYTLTDASRNTRQNESS